MSETENYSKFLLLNLIETFWPLETPEEEREFRRLMEKPKLYWIPQVPAPDY